MKCEHKATKDVFTAPKNFPTIRAAMKKKLNARRAEMLPSVSHTFISPSQPHSKMH